MIFLEPLMEATIRDQRVIISLRIQFFKKNKIFKDSLKSFMANYLDEKTDSCSSLFPFFLFAFKIDKKEKSCYSPKEAFLKNIRIEIW